ncbi:MAG: helix-turn-helix domain-containing protein [Pseudomonadota bacterium]|nr:helix-turn-helix domain-containing protein [Pseudomonadota bacterium]
MDEARLIDVSEWNSARWGWLESVRRDTSLTDTARLLAHVLALDYANHRTSECTPSIDELMRVLGKSKSTVKRAVLDLEDGGWIIRESGRGRGRKSGYGFLTRAKVIPLKGVKNEPSKGVSPAPFYRSEKGSNLTSKGVKNGPRLYIDKPYKNHRAGGHVREVVPSLSENPLVIREAEAAVERLRAGRSDALDDLRPWVIGHILAAGLLTDDELTATGWQC